MEKLENKKLFKIIFNYLPLIAILIFALILRLWWLNRLPVGITYDEVEYVLDAKAIYFTGKDISGSWSPLSLITKPVGVLTAEFPALIISPLIGPLELSLFTARLPYALASVLMVFVLYLIAQELFNSKKVALIAALLLSINPWSFHFGRTAFESPMAILFYLIGLYLLLKNRSWRIILSFPFFFLAFFTYLGTKLILLPFSLTLCLFHYFWSGRKRSLKPYIILFLLTLFLVSGYVLTLKYQPGQGRMGDLLIFATGKAAQAVNDERRLTLPNSLMILFSNKALYSLKTFIANYLGAFSPKFLFLFGETRGAFSVWTHGLFYYLDLIFIIIGFLKLFETNKRLWFFLTILAAIAPLPSALGADYESYVLRSALLYPFLILFAAFGISFLINLFRHHRQLLVLGLIAVYSLSLVNYLYIYFFRYPVYGSEGFFFSGRVLTKYLSLYQKDPDKEMIVLSPDYQGLFKQYLFYSRLYNQENAQRIADHIRQGKFEWGNITFTNTCPEESALKNENNILIYKCDSQCEEELEKLVTSRLASEKKLASKRLSISNLADSGEIYRISGDSVCSEYELRTYPRAMVMDDFQVENQETEAFCQKWIMDLTEIKTKAFQQ